MYERAALMLEHRVQALRAEKAPGSFAAQHLAYLAVPGLFPQPLGERGDEALLGHGGRGLRQRAGCGGAQGDLRLVAADALGGGQRARQGEHLAIERTRSSSDEAMDILSAFKRISCCSQVGMSAVCMAVTSSGASRFSAAFDFREQALLELPGRRGRGASGATPAPEIQRFGPGGVLQSDIALG